LHARSYTLLYYSTIHSPYFILFSFIFYTILSCGLSISTLFPYTTLFRSVRRRARAIERDRHPRRPKRVGTVGRAISRVSVAGERSEEHTSELQSRENLVCCLLLGKKK